MTPISVAVIGNHRHQHCSEAVWVRAFAKLGCAVTALQVEDVARDPEAAMPVLRRNTLVTYTRTHSRGMFLDQSWTARWRQLEDGGTRTIGLHLDRFWDLEREHLIGTDAQFSVGSLWTADGGNDERWQKAGIDHRWFPPGIDEDEAIVGTARPEYAHDIVFVGSGGQTYHAAYAGRRDLLEHLRQTYRGRFAHYGHGGDRPAVRGPALADIYASSRIVIGDSCFANEKGSPRSFRYFSDRIPESLGRQAFLLHPYVPGIRALYSAALATYGPADWEDLDAQIGSYLANPGDREGMAEAGRAHVLKEHTYTVRLRSVLGTHGLLPIPAPSALMG